MAITKHTVEVTGGNPVVIYGETANINYFLATDITADEEDGVTNSAVQVAGFTREQYPGDTSPINVAGSQREFMVDPTRKSSTALPGRNFVLRERGGAKERRQFTFQGRMMDLHAFLSGNLAKNVFLYGPTGSSSKLDAD
jgi:hypothetical protein